MQIKLTCSACKGEVIYQKEKPQDQDDAHRTLHAVDCAYQKERCMSYVAEHGIPVESEVLA